MANAPLRKWHWVKFEKLGVNGGGGIWVYQKEPKLPEEQVLRSWGRRENSWQNGHKESIALRISGREHKTWKVDVSARKTRYRGAYITWKIWGNNKGVNPKCQGSFCQRVKPEARKQAVLKSSLVSKRIGSRNLSSYFHNNVHNNISDSDKRWKEPKCPSVDGRGKHHVEHTHSGILLSLEDAGHSDTYYNTDEAWRHVKCNKLPQDGKYCIISLTWGA